jgi:hypothetical protein
MTSGKNLLKQHLLPQHDHSMDAANEAFDLHSEMNERLFPQFIVLFVSIIKFER